MDSTVDSGSRDVARAALSKVSGKAFGLAIGGKIAVARRGEHVAVALFLCVGLGHRAL